MIFFFTFMKYFFSFMLNWFSSFILNRMQLFLYKLNQLTKIFSFELKCLFWFKCRGNFVRYSKWRRRNFRFQWMLSGRSMFRVFNKKIAFFRIMINFRKNSSSKNWSTKRKINNFFFDEKNWRFMLISSLERSLRHRRCSVV